MTAVFFTRPSEKLYEYQIESWRRVYNICTNNSGTATCLLLFVDFLHISWAFVGTLMDEKYVKVGSKGDAITDCIGEYGWMTTMQVYVIMMTAYTKFFRVLYLFFVFKWHKYTFGCWSNKTTIDQHRFSDGPIELKFETWKLGKDQEETCDICSQKIDQDSFVVQLPCRYQHIFDAECLREWFKGSNECPTCGENVIQEQHDI